MTPQPCPTVKVFHADHPDGIVINESDLATYQVRGFKSQYEVDAEKLASEEAEAEAAAAAEAAKTKPTE